METDDIVPPFAELFSAHRNRLGFRGISEDKPGRFRASIGRDKQQRSEYFSTPNEGDYAGLDKGRNSFYSYARQAGALLICLIMLWSYIEHDVAFAGESPSGGGDKCLCDYFACFYRDTVFGRALLSTKGMEIFYDSKCVEPFGAGQFFIGDRCIVEHGLLGGKSDVPPIIPFRKLDLIIVGHGPRHSSDQRSVSNTIGRCHPPIFNFESNCNCAATDGLCNNYVPMYWGGKNIGSQLLNGTVFRTSNQPTCGQPQGKSGEEKQKSNGHQKRVGDFESVAIERRPELGSLLSIIIGFGAAFPLAAIAADLIDARRRVLGYLCLLIVGILGFQATVGLLFGFDLWSLGRWFL